MTAANMTVRGFVLSYGQTDEVEIRTTKVVESYKKTLVVVNSPTAPQAVTTAKVSKVLDLQRIQVSFKIEGMVDQADIPKLRRLIDVGTVPTTATGYNEIDLKHSLLCYWERFTGTQYNLGSAFPGVIQDCDITKDQNEQDEQPVSLTIIAGVKF